MNAKSSSFGDTVRVLTASLAGGPIPAYANLAAWYDEAIQRQSVTETAPGG